MPANGRLEASWEDTAVANVRLRKAGIANLMVDVVRWPNSTRDCLSAIALPASSTPRYVSGGL